MNNSKFNLYQYYIFYVLFGTLMSVASFAQIMYYQGEHQLINYGYSYAAMAISGALTQALFVYIRKVSSNIIIKVAFLLYGFAMYLRIFADSSIISITSGLIGGFGATIILIYIRLSLIEWASNYSNNEHKIISSRHTIVQITTLVGVAISGSLITYLSHIGIDLREFIVILACLMGLLMFCPQGVSVTFESNTKFKIFSKDSVLIKVAISSLLLGFLVSLYEPLIPVFIKNVIPQLGLVSIYTTICGVLTVLGSLWMTRERITSNLVYFLSFFALLLGVTFIVSTEFSDIYKYLITIVMFSLLYPAYFQLRDVYEYDLIQNLHIPKPMIVAVSQTSLMFGDSAGTPISSWVFEKRGYDSLIIYYGIFSICIAVVFFIMWRNTFQKTVKPHIKN